MDVRTEVFADEVVIGGVEVAIGGPLLREPLAHHGDEEGVVRAKEHVAVDDPVGVRRELAGVNRGRVLNRHAETDSTEDVGGDPEASLQRLEVRRRLVLEPDLAELHGGRR